MGKKRQTRNIGSVIFLGDTAYRITSIEGFGGSTVVYRAIYEDKLNKDSFHQVLIKELFPYHPKGLIYRNEAGEIVCNEECTEFFVECKECFYQGNQANLELLMKEPEYISGNVNSYEAYGTFYSVLYLHGGECLGNLLEEGKYQTLSEAAMAILKILDALEAFHKNELLHLDISPDNILMLSKQAMLIDYNSVWPIHRKKEKIYYYSRREGYSAPEIRLRKEKEISAATDLYSVCAVFFRLLTGECVSEDDLTKEGHLQKRFRKSLSAFEGHPLTARKKAVQIVCKGLHQLAHKRYQSIGEMRYDMEELLLRLEGKGISDSAVWESSVKSFKTKKLLEGRYLIRQIQKEDEEWLSEEQCLKNLAAGSSYLLKGSGGMGKTQFLMKLWSMSIHDFRKQIPIVIYIPLCDYQKREAENNFIRKAILRQLNFSTETLEDALHELEQVFVRAGKSGHRYVLLLDGLNEAGSHREYLLKEIEELNRYEGIGILVTDRTDAVKKYGLNDFEITELLPLTEVAIEQEVNRQNLTCPSDEMLKHLLSNPMMLQLYCKTCSMDYMAKDAGDHIDSVDGLISFYLENLEKQEHRKFSGDEKEQLRISYLLNHLLPKCADELKQHKKTLFSLEELYGILKKDYQILQRTNFGLAFPEYMGKTRLMFKELNSDKEWFDYAVEEQLVGHLNLLEKTQEGNYGLIHDNYIECLAEKARGNRTLLRTYQRKAVLKKAVTGIISAAVIIFSGVMFWTQVIHKDPKKNWNEFLNKPMDRLMMNLGVWNFQMESQLDILEEANDDDVLYAITNGDTNALEEFHDFISHKERSASSYKMQLKDGTEYLDYLTEKNLDTLVEDMKDLYQAPYDLYYVTEEFMKYLQPALCDYVNTIYITAEDREYLVSSYQAYLESIAFLNYWTFNHLLIEVDDETAEEMLACMENMSVFKKIWRDAVFLDETADVEKRISDAEKMVKDAINELALLIGEEVYIFNE